MQLLAWGGFLLLISIFLALDLGVFHKTNETPTAKSALKWTGVWFSVAMTFNIAVYFIYEAHFLGLGLTGGGEKGLDVLPGREAALQFFMGYIVEMSLSLDNIFVIALIFKFFRVAGEMQHRVLFWGILGAIVLRIVMILLGAALVQSFTWSIQIFGVILVYTAIKMATSKGDDDFDPEQSSIVKLARRMMSISPKTDGAKFFTYVDGKRMATPLFLVLLVVEGSDVVFAVDSIPAVFGVTREPFIVFTSNIFAILGLRSLYFALASMLRQFAYLKYSLIAVLMFVGVKMLIAVWFHVPSTVSLAIIVGTLAAGVIASRVLKKEDDSDEEPPRSVVAPEPAAAEPPAPKDAEGT
jgi:tellurite resistance protein TerC